MRALLFLALLGSTAYAGNNEVSFGSSIRSVRSSSANAVTDQAMAGPAFTYGRALDLELPVDGMRLWTQVAFEEMLTNGTMFSTLDTEVEAAMLTAGVELRYQVVPHIFANARVAFGGEQTRLQLTDSMNHTASDHGWAGVARGALQLDVMLVDKPRFGLAIRVEVGYLAASGVELTPKLQQDDSLKISIMESSLGHLDLSGWYSNIGVMSQF